MLNNTAFYHKVFRRAIVAFGTMFSDIKVHRHDNEGNLVQTIAVPIAQAPKEKWIVRVDSDPALDNHTYTTLPRMSFEITGISYDSTRKVGRMNKISAPGTTTRDYVFAPVPYNLDISLYILTKTQEDAFQIVEQILPFFTPEFTLGVKSVDNLELVTDMPIILNSVQQQDDYDGDFQTRRFVTYTLTFTLKLNMFGPTNEGKIITRTIVDIGDIDNSSIDPLQAVTFDTVGDPTDGSSVTTTVYNYGPPNGTI